MKVEILKQKDHDFLWIDDQLWMWDLPFEVEIQYDLAQQASGRVLVAGYGLGIVQRFLGDNPAVTEILTIEKYQEVIDECKRVYGQTCYGGIMILDFFDAVFGVEESEKYDYVIGDIWPEISAKHLYLYEKFKIKAKEALKSDGKMLCWGMDYYEYLLSQKGESG